MRGADLAASVRALPSWREQIQSLARQVLLLVVLVFVLVVVDNEVVVDIGPHQGWIAARAQTW